jgi:hypothetical protein
MSMGKKILSLLLAALVGSVMTAVTVFAASEFEGTWTVTDWKDHSFDITLSADGNATGTRSKDMTGTWKEEGSAAVIKWTTGWVTKITKEGDKYVKQTLKPDGTAGKTSDAVKKQ